MRHEEMLSLDEVVREPGIYYNPDDGIIIKVSRVEPLLELAEELAAGKKGGEKSTVFMKISGDPGLNDDEVEMIVRRRMP